MTEDKASCTLQPALSRKSHVYAATSLGNHISL